MDKDEIKAAVKEAIAEERDNFFVDPETHHDHHKFIETWIKWMDDSKGTIRRALIHALVWAVLGLLLAGFFFYVKTGGK